MDIRQTDPGGLRQRLSQVLAARPLLRGLLRALGGKDVQSAAETIAGLAPALSALFAQQKTAPPKAEAAESAENPFAPIAPFADAQIVYSLNRYFAD